MQKNYHDNIVKDLLWYFIGTAVPILVSIIRSPIFTRVFSPEEYGYYTLTFLTYNIFSILFYSWIISCVWRFYFNYKNKKSLNVLFSNLSFFYILSSLILLIITIVWIYIANDLYLKKLVIYCFFYYFINEAITISLIPIRLEGKAGLYNIINSLRAFLGFGIICLLTFKLNYRIESFLISYILINFIVFLYIVFFRKSIGISIKHIQFKFFKELVSYGFASIALNLSLIILNSSDRYVIKIYNNMDTVGIYNQIYNISNISIIALINVFFNAINPHFFIFLENRKVEFDKGVIKFILPYIYLLLPLTVYFCIYAKGISVVMLGPEFRSGYTMIPYIVISAFIYGLSMFYEQNLKFANKYRILIFGVTVSCLINILLNFLLIPKFGYQIASVTTFIAFLILFLIFAVKSRISLIFNKEFLKNIYLLCLVLLTQIGINLLLKKIFNYNNFILWSIIEGILFVILYLLITRKKNPFIHQS